MMSDADLWKTLQVGDHVRVIHFPSFTGYLHDDTRKLYEELIENQTVLTIAHIDELSLPWCDWHVVTNDAGQEEQHKLALNHDGLERVE